jgi:capsular polysaccharide biosynthesis protein
MKNKGVYLIAVFILFIIISITLIFFKSKEEYKSEYNFVITKIESSSKQHLIFYDKKKTKYLFTNYIFTKNELIFEGDMVIKKANSKVLYIYRKHSITHKYELFLKKYPNGYFFN